MIKAVQYFPFSFKYLATDYNRFPNSNNAIIIISNSIEISIRLHIAPVRNPCALRFEIKRATSPLLSPNEHVLRAPFKRITGEGYYITRLH